MANQNEYLSYGWSNQSLGNTAGQSGYAQPGNAPAATTVSTAEQASAGAPSPLPGNVTEILTNPGYAASPALITPGNLTVTALATVTTGTSYQNPSGLAANVVISGGTISGVSVAPDNNGAPGTYVQVGTTDGTYGVPAGGFIKVSFTGTPTWAWTAVN